VVSVPDISYLIRSLTLYQSHLHNLSHAARGRIGKYKVPSQHKWIVITSVLIVF
jgi:hypothetical protein